MKNMLPPHVAQKPHGKVFRAMERLFVILIVCCLLLAPPRALAQRAINGKVTDAKTNIALGGVRVVVKGTSAAGTVTKPDGTFTVTAQTGNTLVFTSVGYKKKEVAVSDAPELNAQLAEDVLQLEQAVVTAIGIRQEKKALAYSTQQVEQAELQQARQPNVLSGIQGRIAGVQITPSSGAPGASVNVRIRGVNSLLGNNQPLYIIDGLFVDNSEIFIDPPLGGVDQTNRSVDINPEDVESINILKGAAATALYGLQAANGAIIINTKKGQADGKTSINYSYSIGFDQVNRLPQMQNTFGQGINGVYLGPESPGNPAFSWGPRLDTMLYSGVPTLYSRDGGLVPRSQQGMFPNSRPVTTYDPFKFFQTGVTSQHNLSLGGGNERGTYFASFSDIRQTGTMPNATFARTTLRLNADYKLFSDLKATTTIMYARSGGQRLQRGANTTSPLFLYRTPPTFDNTNGSSDPMNDPNAYLITLPNGVRTQRSWRGVLPNGAGLVDNPYFSANNNLYNDQTDRVIGGLQLDYTPADWFGKDVLGDVSVTYRIGGDVYSTFNKGYFAQFNALFPAGQVTEQNVNNSLFNSDFFIRLNRDFSSDARMTLVLGNQIVQNFNRNFISQGDGLAVPGFYNITNTASQLTTETQVRFRRAALFGTLSLELLNWIYINGSIRNEWSSTLPANNNSFLYGNISAGFVFTEPLGLTDSEVFSFGKLRASYATVGSDAPAYSLQTPFVRARFGDPNFVQQTFFPIRGISGFVTNRRLGNPDLRPESTTEIEVGAELKFFLNRLSIDVTYFNRTSRDQIFPVPITNSSGYEDRIINSGSIRNSGIEVLANGLLYKDDDWKVDVTLNFSTLQNQVLELASGVNAILLAGGTPALSAQVQARPGFAYGSIFGLGYLRAPDGQLVLNAAGLPQLDPTQRDFGTNLPNWLGGVRPSIRWKGLTVSALLDLRGGGKLWNGTRGTMNQIGTAKETENRNRAGTYDGVTIDANNVVQGVQAVRNAQGQVTSYTPNTTAVAGGLGQNFWFSLNNNFLGMTETLVEDISWVRLREVTVSYELPKSILEPLQIIQGAEVFFTGRNLWLSTAYKGIDPETSLYSTVGAGGIEYYNTPGIRTYLFGVRLNF
jgi:TonB-linked SusC/RagA family outer membrane protein